MINRLGITGNVQVNALGSEHASLRSLNKKRSLILGRKAMTNLNSLLKSRDIIMPTKIHMLKAMVFQVVIYACKSWTIKKG